MDSLADRSWTSSLGFFAALAALGLGSAAAQDYSAGKTAAQLFQSDCTACHKSPAGLAKGMDARSLTSFLREHYTTKEESAAALASYLAGARGAAEEGRPKGQAPASASSSGPKPRTAAHGAEGEPELRARPRAAAEPAAQPEEETDAARERPAHPAAAVREGARVETEGTVRKLESYASSGGDAKDTERSAETVKTLESYAGAGSPAEAITQPEGGTAATKPKPAEKKKKAAPAGAAGGASGAANQGASASATAAHAPAPRRPPAPIPHRPTGNN